MYHERMQCSNSECEMFMVEVDKPMATTRVGRESVPICRICWKDLVRVVVIEKAFGNEADKDYPMMTEKHLGTCIDCLHKDALAHGAACQPCLGFDKWECPAPATVSTYEGMESVMCTPEDPPEDSEPTLNPVMQRIMDNVIDREPVPVGDSPVWGDSILTIHLDDEAKKNAGAKLVLDDVHLALDCDDDNHPDGWSDFRDDIDNSTLILRDCAHRLGALHIESKIMDIYHKLQDINWTFHEMGD